MCTKLRVVHTHNTSALVPCRLRSAPANKKANAEFFLRNFQRMKFSLKTSSRAFLQRFLSSHPPSSSVLYLGVLIEEKLGDERARTEYSDRILREFPQSPEAKQVLELYKG